jgi:XTP/dITP diphosphohydrolase
VREFRALLAGAGIEPLIYDRYADVVEGESDYEENAALKARTLRQQLLSAGITSPVLADDSGLEVAALDGSPGVVTADYGGRELSWHDRRMLILDELAGTGSQDRRARFVTHLHYIAADGTERRAFGAVDGDIAEEERGELGFSFDPIFWYPPLGRTFAEMTEAEKNAVSHRAAAVNALLTSLAMRPPVM